MMEASVRAWSEAPEPAFVDVTILIPAYNEDKVIGRVVAKLREAMAAAGRSFEILVVNDGSTDNTAQAAAEAGATVLDRAYNMGNGAAVKAGMREARGNYILLMDGDGQHTAEDALRILQHIEEKKLDMVVGCRTYSSQAGQHRALANTVYNMLASYVVGRTIPDLTSGMRVIRSEIAREFINLLPNTFSYPTTLTLALFRSGYAVGYLSIEAKARTGKSKIRLFRDGARFLLIIMKVCTLVSPLKIFLPAVGGLAVLGTVNFAYTWFFLGHRFTNMSLLLYLFSGNLLLLGLIAEQITQLYYSRPFHK